MNYHYGYPATVNSHPECVQLVRKAAQTFLEPSDTNVPQKTMGAEDFSYFLQEIPGAFIFVGYLFLLFNLKIYIFFYRLWI
jgi:amidohydrolase